MMIYKVSMTEICLKEIITGVGYGNFKVKYNQWQASYFSTRPAYTHEVSFAENTYFAFNDFFQFIAETGIAGFIMLLILLLLFAKKFKKQKEQILKKPLLAGAWLALISLCVAALFFYTFQIFAVYPLLIFSLAIILNTTEERPESVKKEITNPLYSENFVATKTFTFAICLLILVFGIQAINFEKKLEDAKQLSSVGMKLKALDQLEKLSSGTVWNKDLWFTYAEVLYKLNENDSALIILNKSAQYIYDDNTALLYAKLYSRKGNLAVAEHYYQEAINVIPKLYRHRFSLLNFYLETNQVSSAQKTAQYILSMPYESNQTDNINIRNKTLEILKRINSH